MTTELATLRRVADMHAVYRMFDPAGRLLYIGMTGDAGQRFADHAAKRWFPQVEMIKLEWFQTKAAAQVAEQRAIQSERPRHNIAGRRTPQVRKLRLVPPLLIQDLLEVLGDEDRIWSSVAAERLGQLRPASYGGWDAPVLGKAVRKYGIRTRQIWLNGANRQGFHRRDLQTPPRQGWSQ